MRATTHLIYIYFVAVVTVSTAKLRVIGDKWAS